MKNKINNRLLILTTLGAISLNGCASKTIKVIDSNVHSTSLPHIEKKVEKEPKVSKWKSIIKRDKREDCVDCYAKIVKEPKERVASVDNSTTVYGYDYTKAFNSQSDRYNKIELEEDEDLTIQNSEIEYEEGNSYFVDASYSEDKIEEKEDKEYFYAEAKNSSYLANNTKLLSKNSIQVGAFRKYAGAKVYAKRYSLLTSKYNVDIKENVKDNQPIYRVQIEGFSNEREARDFMERYSLDGAFLVRR